MTLERYLVAAGPEEPVVTFCTQCSVQAEFLNMAEASNVAGISRRDLFRLSKTGLIHSVETNVGQILFCQKSLSAVHGGIDR